MKNILNDFDLSKYDLIVLMGPTASGKTRLAVRWAASIDSEILSADSRQVYKQLNIGTGKDLQEYTFNSIQVPVHLIDIVEPGSKYHINQYKKDFFSIYSNLIAQGKLPIVCGGTGLYIQSILAPMPYTEIPVNETLRNALNPLLHSELQQQLFSFNNQICKNFDVSTKKRTIRAIEICSYLENQSLVPTAYPYPKRPLLFCLHPSREERRTRISTRLNTRLQQGLIEEVGQLLAQNINPADLIYYGLEYKFVTEYLLGNYTYEVMFQKLEVAIHQYAKRQMTWFRKMEQEGWPIYWI